MAAGTPYKVCGGSAGTGSATLIVTVATSTTAGDAIAVWVTSNGNNITSVTDTQSNSYSAAGSQVTNGALNGQWFIATLNVKKLTAATDTITLTLGGTATSKTLSAVGCSGIAASGALDQAPTPTTNTSTSLSITSAALSEPGEMCLAGSLNGNGGGAPTWGSSFNGVDTEHAGTTQFASAAYLAAVSTAAVTASATIVSSTWGLTLLTLVSAAAPFTGQPAARRRLKTTQGGARAGAGGPVNVAVPPAPQHGPAGLPGKLAPQPRRGHVISSPGGPVTAPGLGPPYTVCGGSAGSGSTTLTVTVGTGLAGASGTAGGDAVVVAAFFNNGTITSCADSKGNTYTLAKGDANQVPVASVFVALNTTALAAGVDTITVTFSNTGGTKGLIARGCSGIATATAVDVAIAGDGSSGTSPTSGTSGSLAQPSEWAIAALSTGNPGGTPTAWAGGFIAAGTEHTGSGQFGTVADQVVTSTAPVTASATIINASWAMVLVTLRAAAAATPAPFARAGKPVHKRTPPPRKLPPLFSPGGPVTAAPPVSTPSPFTAPKSPAGLTGPLAPRRRRGRVASSPGAGLNLPAWTALLLTLRQPTLPQVVQQISGTAAPTHGMSSVEMTSTEGNALILLAGWDVTPVSSAPLAWVNVTDSEGNYWVHLGTSADTNPGSRCAVWACTNAHAVQWVSCALSTFASSLAYLIVEVSGLPSLTAVSVSVSGQNAAASSLTLAAAGGVADIGFAVLAAGSSAAAVTTGPAGWTPLKTVTAGSGKPNPVQIFPYWLPSVPATATLTASWALSGGGGPLSAAMVSIESSPAAPVQNNPNFPVLKVEAGFGYTPGDPSAGPPAWTDITSRCIGKTGDPWIAWTYGREYELSTPEAGTITIGVNNQDGAFTPGNLNSPYAPDVKLGTPIRVSAFWEGRWYYLAYGYVERWPQEWPDLRQWGLSKMIASDAWAVLSSTTMPSALQGTMLLDSPYSLHTFGEQYFTATSGFTKAGTTGPGILSTVTPSEAQGLIAANASRTNQRPGFYTDGSAAQVVTGQTLGLLGDSGTGMGATSAAAGQDRGPGVIYTDQMLPGPVSPNGCTVEFWFVKNDNQECTLFGAYPAPSPYNLGQFAVVAEGGSDNHLIIFLPGIGAWQSVPFTPGPGPQHLLMTFTPAPNLINTPVLLALHLNGSLAGSWAVPVAQVQNWTTVALGCVRYQWGFQPFVSNYVAADLAVYDYPLPVVRIHDRWELGSTGNAGHTFIERVGDILSWGFLGLPRGGPVTYQKSQGDVFCGAAYALSGSTAADAINIFQAGDSGVAVAMPSGALTVLPRWWLNNLTPSAAFGDAIDGSEIPYLPAMAWDFDNTYLYNVSQATRISGPTQGITVVTKDEASQNSYFTRSALSQGLQTTADYDAYGVADLALAQYSQPSLRVRAMTVDAASNPAAWTTVLSLRVTDVATVARRPVGGAAIVQSVQIQKVTGRIGPGVGQVDYQLSPYTPQNAILTLDVPGYDVLGGNTLGE